MAMLTKGDKIFFATLLVLIGVSAIFWKDVRSVFGGDYKTQTLQIATQQENEAKEKGKEKEGVVTPGVDVVKTWELPSELTEISGLAFIDENRFLCIEDEQGVLYIYNKESNKIVKQIPFSDVGDYEGLAIAGSTAYVVNSSGTVFEISNFEKGKPSIQKYKTALTGKNDVEGVAYDESANRLLITVKEDSYQDKKGIYAFDLSKKTLNEQPALEMDFNNKVFDVAVSGKKKKSKGIKPSSIDFHSGTGDIYVLEGTNPKLLIMDKSGAPRKIYILDTKSFPQPEGLAFDAEGNLFISNEGGKGKGTIVQVSLK